MRRNLIVKGSVGSRLTRLHALDMEGRKRMRKSAVPSGYKYGTVARVIWRLFWKQGIVGSRPGFCCRDFSTHPELPATEKNFSTRPAFSQFQGLKIRRSTNFYAI